MRFPRTIAARLILLVGSSTALILAVTLSLNYLRSRVLLEREVETSAHNLALASTHRVQAVLGTAARAVDSMARRLEAEPISDPAMRSMMRGTLENNPEIYGTAIAFEPDPSKGGRRLYAPYYYRSGAAIQSMQVEDGYNYLVQDWYQIPVELAQARWSEPYFDEGAGNQLMATYSVPFFTGSGESRRIRGVVTADITLDWLTRIVGSIKVLDSGYAFLLSRNGAIVTHPVAEHIMNQTIFTLAEADGNEGLREIGRRMVNGETGFVPHINSSGVPARLLYAPIPAAGWSLAIVFPESELFAGLRDLTISAAAFGVGGTLLFILVVVLVARSITQPLRMLAVAAGRMSRGDFEVQLPALSAGDEVGDLSRAFAAMKRDLQEHIRNLVATTSAKERIESELSVAHDIQMSILPKMLPPFPKREEFNLYAVIEPAKEVGGDFYDFFELDENHLCLVIADVSGKGVPASLFMAVTKTLIKATARIGLSPAEILCQVNDQMARDNDQSMFVTVFLAVLDLFSGELVYANAGHNPPMIFPLQGEPHYLPKARQLVIGAMTDYRYRDEVIHMKPGERLFLYTDGVTEAMNLQDDLYGEKRLLAAGTELRHEPLDLMVKGTITQIMAFAGAAAQSDDITIMVIDFLGRKGSP